MPVQRSATAAVLILFFALTAVAQQPVIHGQWNVDQKKLEAGDYKLPFVLQAGQRFFTTPYLPYNATTKHGDGYGEGPNGPRWAARQVFYRGTQYGWPFLRLNGLDSQSCYECHNSIGSYKVQDQYGGGFIRKPGTVGGAAGSNSNAFINSGFPNPMTFLIRNPPHTFGTGYTQTLADEMTYELLTVVSAARVRAKQSPGTWVEQKLSAKTLDFGSFRTRYDKSVKKGVLVNCKDQCDPGGLTPYLPPSGFTDDLQSLTGVSCDFVVRPFQWKGIASSIRHFVRDALDFHLSMQAVEKYAHADCDLDGKVDEMSLGNVSALTSLVAMTRPPQQVFPSDPRVVRGRAIFMGEFAGAVKQMCATCHVPSLQLYTKDLFVDNPGVATEEPSDCKVADHPIGQEKTGHIHRQSLSSPNSYEDHPAYSRLGIDPNNTYPLPEYVPSRGLPCPRKQGPGIPAQQGYCIDLSNLPPDVPEHVLPRLPRAANGVITVPLFSDLRTHDMGPNLADIDLNGIALSQGLDVAGLCATTRSFVTRPLWGVGDTGPWLHDGRALTLMNAITFHGGEAQEIVDAFEKLPLADREAVVTFLLSMQLPCLNSISCPPVPLGESTAALRSKETTVYAAR